MNLLWILPRGPREKGPVDTPGCFLCVSLSASLSLSLFRPSTLAVEWWKHKFPIYCRGTGRANGWAAVSRPDAGDCGRELVVQNLLRYIQRSRLFAERDDEGWRRRAVCRAIKVNGMKILTRSWERDFPGHCMVTAHWLPCRPWARSLTSG